MEGPLLRWYGINCSHIRSWKRSVRKENSFKHQTVLYSLWCLTGFVANVSSSGRDGALVLLCTSQPDLSFKVVSKYCAARSSCSNGKFSQSAKVRGSSNHSLRCFWSAALIDTICTLLCDPLWQFRHDMPNTADPLSNTAWVKGIFEVSASSESSTKSAQRFLLLASSEQGRY